VVGDDADELVEWGLKVLRGELSIDQIEHARDGADPELIAVGPSMRERIYAWRFLVEHHSGKAPQTINLNAMSPAEPVYDWGKLTDPELEQLEVLLAKASVGSAKPADVEVVAVAAAKAEG
jgi:hypothetical protein